MDAGRLTVALEGLARESLRKAWTDFYVGSYDWVLEKAYRAAAILLAPYTAEPSLPLEALRRACPGHIIRRLQALDYRRRLALSPMLKLVLGDLETMPGRAEALGAIEAVVMLASSIGECQAPEGDLARLVLNDLLDYGVSRGATILLQGETAIIIRDTYTGTDPRTRIEDEDLPRAPSLLLLAPDEALALVHLPHGRKILSGAEVLTDRAGIAHLLL